MSIAEYVTLVVFALCAGMNWGLERGRIAWIVAVIIALLMFVLLHGTHGGNNWHAAFVGTGVFLFGRWLTPRLGY